MKFVASVPEGLEKCLSEEISQLGAGEIKTHKRFVEFECDFSSFYKIHCYSRLPFRFYREIARFPCNDKQSLYRGVINSFDWLSWLPAHKTFCVNVTGKSSYLSHSHFTALQVKNAIVDLQYSAWGQRSDISTDQPYLVIHLHIHGGEGILSLQSSHVSLHKRGYRPAIGNAPLKENLAAGLIQMTKWDGSIPLIDIMCGSGTLLIEGVAGALKKPCNIQERYIFQNWLDFDEELFLRNKLKDFKRSDADAKISKVVGCEINDKVFIQAKKNVSLAGLDNYIDLLNIDFSNFNYSSNPGIILCNPPYGKQLGSGEPLEELYTKIGDYLKDNFSGWQFWLLSGNSKLTQYLRMRSSLKIPVSNGGIDCRWIKYEIR